MTEIFFERPYVTVTYNSQTKLGKAVWRGFLSTEEFREAARQCLNLISGHEISYWIADNRQMKAIRQHDQDWFCSAIIPELQKTNLKKMATLVSEDIFNKMAVESMLTKTAPLLNFENHYFNSEIRAMDWLLPENKIPGLQTESQSELTEPELT